MGELYIVGTHQKCRAEAFLMSIHVFFFFVLFFLKNAKLLIPFGGKTYKNKQKKKTNLIWCYGMF